MKNTNHKVTSLVIDKEQFEKLKVILLAEDISISQWLRKQIANKVNQKR